jgi:hypothetical protein
VKLKDLSTYRKSFLPAFSILQPTERQALGNSLLNLSSVSEAILVKKYIEPPTDSHGVNDAFRQISPFIRRNQRFIRRIVASIQRKQSCIQQIKRFIQWINSFIQWIVRFIQWVKLVIQRNECSIQRNTSFRWTIDHHLR